MSDASKPTPRYQLLFRWGDFHLNITSRRAILWWVGIACAIVGFKFLIPHIF
jgi:hypothetical protein